jgi:hypothetical protein
MVTSIANRPPGDSLRKGRKSILRAAGGDDLGRLAVAQRVFHTRRSVLTLLWQTTAKSIMLLAPKHDQKKWSFKDD